MPRPSRRAEGDKKRRRRDEDSVEFREKNRLERIENWIPKTSLGKKVKNGEIASLDQIWDSGQRVLEPEIVDVLLPGLMEKTVEFKKTARVIRSGRVFSYRATVLIGNQNGFVGVGIASDRERSAAAQKASSQARLNLVRVYRGCGSWECVCGTRHSLPFKVGGQCGSVRVQIIPAPKGVGLVVGNEVKDVYAFAGVSDVWTKTQGHTATQLNFIRATINALAKTSQMKQAPDIQKKLEHIREKM